MNALSLGRFGNTSPTDCRQLDPELALFLRMNSISPTGLLYPRNGDWRQECPAPFLIQTECLLESCGNRASLDVSLKFLQILRREVFANGGAVVGIPASADRQRPGTLESVTGKEFLHTSRATIEREVQIPSVWLLRGRQCCLQRVFEFPASRSIELLSDDRGEVTGAIVHRQHSLKGMVELQSWPVDLDVLKVRVRILNQTTPPIHTSSDPKTVIECTFASTHAILHTQDGCFLSPEELEITTGACENIGTWPVMVGASDQARCSTIISSPAFAAGMNGPLSNFILPRTGG